MKELIRIYGRHYKGNLFLAFPVMMSQAGQMIVALTDNLMVGQLGAVELAAVALANNIFVIGMMFAIGLISAITPIAGKAIGAKDRLESSTILKQAVYMHPLSGVIITGILLCGIFIMPHMGQDPAVIKVAIPYYIILCISIIPLSIFFVFRQYAEALGNTRVAMQVTLTGAVINIGLNYLLIFGKLGFPQLGVEGAGYATLLCRVYMSIAAIILFFRMDLFKPDRKNWKLTKFDLIKSMHLLRIGVPIGSQYITEMLAFSIGSFMMGWIGTNALAAHQVVMSLVGFTYMVSAGLASATTIKVSHFRGQRNLKEMNRAIYASIHMVGLFMFCSLLIFYNFRFFIPSLFIQDPAVIAIASKLMIIAAMFQLFDGFQVNMLGALRGMEDVRIPMILLAIAYFAIALPFSYLAGIALKFGPQGVWFGYLFGLFLVSVQLYIRYKYKAKRLKV